MFFEKFLLTSGTLPEPKFRRVSKRPPWNEMSAGLYNEGLVTVFCSDYDDSFLLSWSWLIGNNVILLGCTCWGDFFYVDMNEGEFYIVLADQYKKFAMGNSFASVFDKNLAAENFQRDILRPNEFALFKADAGALKYGEVYVLNTRKGVRERKNLSIFLDVSGQTGQQLQT